MVDGVKYIHRLFTSKLIFDRVFLLPSRQFNTRTWNRPDMAFCFMLGATPNLIRIGRVRDRHHCKLNIILTCGYYWQFEVPWLAKWPNLHLSTFFNCDRTWTKFGWLFIPASHCQHFKALIIYLYVSSDTIDSLIAQRVKVHSTIALILISDAQGKLT
jgi:hypothetical protein